MFDFFDLYGYGPSLLRGLWMTIAVASAAMVVAIAMGLLGAAAKLSDSRTARTLAGAYTTIVRGIPEIVLLLLVYWGTQQLIQDLGSAITGRDVRVDFSPFRAGVMTLGVIYGAFATEVFRGALAAISRGQIEAARAAGMSPLKTFFRIQMPQMWRFALPGLGNVWLVLTKGTALVSLIHLSELMRQTNIAVGATKKPFTFYAVAAGCYLCITIVSMIAIHFLERRANRGIRAGVG